jgi:aspartate ammonia-lyase
VIADRLIASLLLANEVVTAFAKNCVSSIEADEKRCRELLENSTAYATMLTPKLGYEQVSKMGINQNSTGALTEKMFYNREHDNRTSNSPTDLS